MGFWGRLGTSVFLIDLFTYFNNNFSNLLMSSLIYVECTGSVRCNPSVQRETNKETLTFSSLHRTHHSTASSTSQLCFFQSNLILSFSTRCKDFSSHLISSPFFIQGRFVEGSTSLSVTAFYKSCKDTNS